MRISSNDQKKIDKSVQKRPSKWHQRVKVEIQKGKKRKRRKLKFSEHPCEKIEIAWLKFISKSVSRDILTLLHLISTTNSN